MDSNTGFIIFGSYTASTIRILELRKYIIYLNMRSSKDLANMHKLPFMLMIALGQLRSKPERDLNDELVDSSKILKRVLYYFKSGKGSYLPYHPNLLSTSPCPTKSLPVKVNSGYGQAWSM